MTGGGRGAAARARLATWSIALCCAAAARGAAADAPPSAPPPHPTLLGLQAAVIGQYAPPFRSPHAGPASLPGDRAGVSATATLFLGARLLDALDGYLEPEAATGSAPGQGAGLASPGNGDLLGTPGKVDAYLARAFLRWRVGLGPGRAPAVRIGRERQLVEETVPATRLVLTAGRLAVTDLLDQSSYANSARTQFLALAFTNELAYDFPQDQHGYSEGLLASLVTPSFSARVASFRVPAGPGGALSWSLGRNRGDAVEVVWSPALGGGAGRRAVVRLLAWRNVGRMGRYADALRAAAGGPPSLEAVRRSGRARWGMGIGAEWPLADDGTTGLFARAGLGQGGVEALAFVEADGAISAGVQVSGARWRRPDDRLWVAVGAAFASAAHRAYLAAGGVGLRLGDGGLRYGPELESEAYYALAISKGLALSADVQAIAAPGFDRGRGPVALLSLRVHLEL